MQIPRGPEHLKCPLWRKPMSKVCHTCPWWKQVRGQDPQDSRKELDAWDCAHAWQTPLTIEVGRQQLATAAAVNTMTEEMKKTDKASEAVIGQLLTITNHALQREMPLAEILPPNNPKLLE